MAEETTTTTKPEEATTAKPVKKKKSNGKMVELLKRRLAQLNEEALGHTNVGETDFRIVRIETLLKVLEGEKFDVENVLDLFDLGELRKEEREK